MFIFDDIRRSSKVQQIHSSRHSHNDCDLQWRIRTASIRIWKWKELYTDQISYLILSNQLKVRPKPSLKPSRLPPPRRQPWKVPTAKRSARFVLPSLSVNQRHCVCHATQSTHASQSHMLLVWMPTRQSCTLSTQNQPWRRLKKSTLSSSSSTAHPTNVKSREPSNNCTTSKQRRLELWSDLTERRRHTSNWHPIKMLLMFQAALDCFNLAWYRNKVLRQCYSALFGGWYSRWRWLARYMELTSIIYTIFDLHHSTHFYTYHTFMYAYFY